MNIVPSISDSRWRDFVPGPQPPSLLRHLAIDPHRFLELLGVFYNNLLYVLMLMIRPINFLGSILGSALNAFLAEQYRLKARESANIRKVITQSLRCWAVYW
jgi:hypothetical protein